MLTGMGGIGKTTTIKWYASEHSGDFHHIIWLDSEGREVLAKSLRALADSLLVPLLLNDGITPKGLDILVADIFRELRDKVCLFLLDNVDNPDVHQLLSGQQTHFSILTSRLQRWQEPLVAMEVGLFSKEEAVSYLRKNIDQAKVGSEKELSDLAEALQYLPLAMKQATACIEGLDLTVQDYLKEFQAKSQAVLGYSAGDTEKTILTTWSISVDSIMQKDKAMGELALKILSAISYLNPENIPKSLLLSQASSKLDLSRALELLSQYSLIKVNMGMIRIHRLVQETMRITLFENDKEGKVLHDLLRDLHQKLSVRYWDENLALHMRTVIKYATVQHHKHIVLRCMEIEANIMHNLHKETVKAMSMLEQCIQEYSQVYHGSECQRNILRAMCLLSFLQLLSGQATTASDTIGKVSIPRFQDILQTFSSSTTFLG